MPSLQTYIHSLAYALDDLSVHFLVAVSTQGFGALTLVNGDTHASTSTYNGRWALNATKGQQRRVRTNSYTPVNGTLTIDPAWTLPSVNDEIDLTALFPIFEPGPLGSEMSYREIINRALQLLIVPDRIQIAITPGAGAYSLATWQKWLNAEERFGWPDIVKPDGTHVPQPRLLEPGPTGGIAIPADWRRPHLRLDADVPYLEIEAPFAVGTSGSLTLNVMRPANTWGFVGNVWTEEINEGLVNLTDEARPSVTDVTEIGKLIAFETLTARSVNSASGRWADKVAPQRALCERIRYFDKTRLMPPPAVPQSSPQAA